MAPGAGGRAGAERGPRGAVPRRLPVAGGAARRAGRTLIGRGRAESCERRRRRRRLLLRRGRASSAARAQDDPDRGGRALHPDPPHPPPAPLCSVPPGRGARAARGTRLPPPPRAPGPRGKGPLAPPTPLPAAGEGLRRPAHPAPQRGLGMEPQPGGARSCRRGVPGACDLGPAAEAAPMSLAIQSTTGTRYELSVPADETVEGLRRRLAQRLKVPKERLAVLHKDTRLSSGKLQDLGVGDGSKLTLVPTVEAGLMSQASRPEQSVMQALESLTETQVSDFLSGRSPLTLALRVGDHMMFVQLQLAAQHAPLQPRHVLAARTGDPGPAAPASPRCPTAGAPRVPPVSTGSTPTAPTPVTSGSFCSHSAPASCPEQMDCTTTAGTSTGPPASPATRSRKPGAVIESFVHHAPGIFSGTFSGTLHPNCQDSSGRPRRDIGTILQILHDLLSATRHYQGMPASLAQLRCHAQCAPDLSHKSTSCEKLPAAPAALSQVRVCKPPGDRLRQTENRATRCKVERLQLLLQQKRLRRKARRDARGPYHWPPSRKAGSGGGGGGGGPGEAAGLGLDFEDAVWKPEVNPDIKSEFVVA